jgi:hypothetical protein
MFHCSQVAESQNVAQCVGTSRATEGTFRLRRTIRLYLQPTTQTRLKHFELKQSELPKTLVIWGRTVQRTGLAEVVVQSDAHVHGADFCENALISSISSFASAFARVLLSSMRTGTTPRTFSWGQMSCNHLPGAGQQPLLQHPQTLRSKGKTDRVAQRLGQVKNQVCLAATEQGDV